MGKANMALKEAETPNQKKPLKVKSVVKKDKLKTSSVKKSQKPQKPLIANRPMAGERMPLVLIDNHQETNENKAAYYAFKMAKKDKSRVAFLYVREMADMQLFGLSDVIREENKIESNAQIKQLEEDIADWGGKKNDFINYVREGEISEAMFEFINKNRFVSGLVLTDWQLTNSASGIYNYIANNKKDIRRVPVTIIPSDINFKQIDEMI